MTIQEEIDAFILAQSKLSGEEFNLGDLIKMLEAAPQDMLVDVVLSDGTIMVPHQDTEFILGEGVGYCFDSWRGSYVNLAINVQNDSPRYRVKHILQHAKDTVGQYLTGYKGGEFLMELDTPIYLSKTYGHYFDEKVIDVKIDNDRVHLICRDSSND